MEITFSMFIQGAQMLIAEGMNGKVSVIAVSFKDMGWFLPTSCPYIENTDRFNRPYHMNDNLC